MIKKLKKLLNKKNLKIIWFVYAAFSLALVLYLLNYVTGNKLDSISDKYILSSWDVSINDTYYKNAKLDSLHFQTVSDGNYIEMKTYLPTELDIDSPAIYIPIHQCVVRAYLDDEEFFEYGAKRYADNRPVGNGYQIITLPDNYSDKELKVTFEVTENNIFSTLDNIWISDWKDAYRFVIIENRIPFLLGSFLIVFGIIVAILLIFVITNTSSYMDILLLSLFSICMGLWTISYNNILEIFSVQLHTIALIENVSLLIAPLLILAYMSLYIKQQNNKVIKNIYNILVISQLLMTIGIITLHAVNIAHIYEMITMHYIFFILHIIFFSYVLHKSSKYDKKNKIVYNAAIIFFLISVVYDLFAYIFLRYTGYRLLDLTGVSAIGIITFISVLILDLYHDVTLKKMEQQEKELLIKRAYTDDLTQINNRRFCSEYMDKLQSAKSEKYTIISLDVNNLKQINDTYGHSKGDILIKKAANLISRAFNQTGIVGRMGGDEFIVILPINDKHKIDTLIISFKNILDEANLNTDDMHISIAYGYATSNDVEENNVETVYKLADIRMYEHKKSIKKKMYKVS